MGETWIISEHAQTFSETEACELVPSCESVPNVALISNKLPAFNVTNRSGRLPAPDLASDRRMAMCTQVEKS